MDAIFAFEQSETLLGTPRASQPVLAANDRVLLVLPPTGGSLLSLNRAGAQSKAGRNQEFSQPLALCFKTGSQALIASLGPLRVRA